MLEVKYFEVFGIKARSSESGEDEDAVNSESTFWTNSLSEMVDGDALGVGASAKSEKLTVWDAIFEESMKNTNAQK